jgi:hypothetical protein
VSESNGNFPIVWSCDTPRNLAVGIAEVTTTQENALNSSGVWTRAYTDLSLTIADLPTPQQNVITNWLTRHGIVWTSGDTMQTIVERIMNIGQPGWTWATMEAQLRNWGL